MIMVMLSSLNGRIAKGPDDDLSWGGKADKRFFKDITKQIGTMVMGSTTFEAMGRRLLPDRKTIVLTSRPAQFEEVGKSNATFEATDEAPEELVKRLAAENVKEVAVVGGGKINAAFLAAGLIDEIYWSFAPVAFSPGVPVIADDESGNVQVDVKLELISSEILEGGIILAHYKVIRSIEK